ncbi:uncharacterized protein [Diabrotica undecimpunctata]|uniref:uncharacterized protein n=1 Tax=Diabrotica undecimpunctata TaxID=50387 RepID=UPI003B63A5DD
MIVGRLIVYNVYASRIFSFHRGCFLVRAFQPTLVSFFGKGKTCNRTLFINMPPKRKVVKAEVDAAATSEAEPVKQKRGRKAKEEKVEEANGNVDDDIQDEVPELPKRSGRAKKTVPEYNETATKEAKANKPKRGKKKAAKKEESPVPEEVAEPEEADELSEEEPKPVKKTKKGAAEKSTKKTKKVAADSSEADVPSKKSKKPAAEANGDSKSAEKKSKRGAKSKKNVEEENEDEGNELLD